MHRAKNYHRYLWLLAGTGEGPILAKALISQGWKVSVSVVSDRAALSFEHLPMEDVWIGALDGVEGINRVLAGAEASNKRFRWVIDATHPFALMISSNLRNVCLENGQPLLRFERPLGEVSRATLIYEPIELSNHDLKDRKVLFAIGSRQLREAVFAARIAGANVFARILPTPINFLGALSSGIPEQQVAMLRPFQRAKSGRLELALCRKWSIDCVVCRQSGGMTQDIWQAICEELNLDLYLISRPSPCIGIESFNTIHELLTRISTAK